MQHPLCNDTDAHVKDTMVNLAYRMYFESSNNILVPSRLVNEDAAYISS